MRLESKRHITRFYFSIAFLFLIINTIGVVLISGYFDEDKKEKEGNTVYLLLVGVLLVVFTFYTIYQYLKNVPKIIIDKNKIFFNKEMFRLEDIHFINLTCKVPFRYIGCHFMEGFYIKFKNGTEKFIYDDMYSNIWEIKHYLKQVVEDKKEYKLIKNQEIKPSQIKNDFFVYYSNFQLLGVSGITHFGFIFILLSLVVTNTNNKFANYFLILSILIIFLFHSWLSNHYGISKNYLIIKNFNLPFVFKTRIYKLDDIEEIIFETYPKRPNGLRVVTKNYQSKLFYGAALYDNTWRELKKDLRKKGIKIRDECIDFEYLMKP